MPGAEVYDPQSSVLEVLQNAAGATGNGTAIDLKGIRSMILDITGTFVGTVTFEGTVDDSNWVALGLGAVATGTLATSATAVGMFKLPQDADALSQFRARVSAWTSGNITVKSRKHPR